MLTGITCYRLSKTGESGTRKWYCGSRTTLDSFFLVLFPNYFTLFLCIFSYSKLWPFLISFIYHFSLFCFSFNLYRTLSHFRRSGLRVQYFIVISLLFYCHLFLVVMVTKVFGLNEVFLKIIFNKRPGLHVTWKLMNLPFPESEMGGHSKRAHVCQGCSGWDITGLNKILLF